MATAKFTFVGGGQIVLGRWEQNIDDAGPAFEAMANHQKTIWIKQFDQEGAYTNATWQALSEPYGTWKQKHYPGKKILQLTGRLMESMTNRPFGVDVITKSSMTIGTDVPYAQYHQLGTPLMPQRSIIGKPPTADIEVFGKIMQSWIVRGNVNV